MIWILDAVLFGCILAVCLCFVGWMDERGIREIRLYSDEFLMNEEKAVQCRVLPDPASKKLADRLELALYYSGIRGRYPFVSVKFWVLFQCFAALWVWILVSAGRGVRTALLCACLTPVCFAAVLSLMRTQRYKKDGGTPSGGNQSGGRVLGDGGGFRGDSEPLRGIYPGTGGTDPAQN
ncbi:MAG: hypothetical protein LUC90_05290 [Lachnospiraceae bacterium]|nr:hypothetical protein [Lachnospiraceae bacterium]